jgi:hypothetical protein
MAPGYSGVIWGERVPSEWLWTGFLKTRLLGLWFINDSEFNPDR